jgi:hypothetical protein
LNRLVLNDDAAGHEHVDVITDLNFNLAIADGQRNLAADFNASTTQFIRQACLIG